MPLRADLAPQPYDHTGARALVNQSAYLHGRQNRAIGPCFGVWARAGKGRQGACRCFPLGVTRAPAGPSFPATVAPIVPRPGAYCTRYALRPFSPAFATSAIARGVTGAGSGAIGDGHEAISQVCPSRILWQSPPGDGYPAFQAGIPVTEPFLCHENAGFSVRVVGVLSRAKAVSLRARGLLTQSEKSGLSGRYRPV